MQDGQRLGGCFFGQSSFATHAVAPARCLVRVDRDLPLEILGPLGCGVQTGAGAVMRTLDLQPGATLLVAGAGAVGLSAVMAARLRGCGEIIVLEPDARRRALALELGATRVLDTAPANAQLACVENWVPGGVDAALDCSGNAQAIAACLACLGIRGTLGLIGASAMDTPLPGHVNGLLSRGQTIRGIIEGDSDPRAFIPELLAHYVAGDFPFDRMIRRYPFAEINRAVAEHERGETVKAVLVMD
jgi:aryl-alcohol dehydrogenase